MPDAAANLTYHGGDVAAADRAKLLGGHGATVWFTGLSGSGKSTVAVAVEKALFARGRAAYRLDGDNIRLGLNAGLSFSETDRTENVRRVGEVAKLMADAGLVCLVSFISPLAADRERARAAHAAGGQRFYEVHVDVPLAEAERRDPKGLYQKARAGEIRDFTGISAPYEAPESPDLRLDTSTMTLAEEVAAVLKLLEDAGAA
jgi:adenylylsulfate kinase